MSQSQQPNPLLYPPFFLVNGVDPNLPISSQTEQIDQLNTQLLRDIDANFAKIHQVITSKVLPGIKRFAIAGEPTREAAKFWRSFFEAAAAVRVNSSGETTESQSDQSRTTYEDQTLTLQRDDQQSFSQALEEGSFIFDPPPTSSTPMRGPNATGRRFNQSFEESMESPFDSMDRRLRTELRIGEEDDFGLGSGTSDMPTPSLPSGYDMPDLQAASSNRSHIGDFSTGTVETQTSHIGDTPKNKSRSSSRNIFDNRGDGITDLRSTPLNAKFGGKGFPKSKSTKPPPAFNPTQNQFEDESDLQLNMSPPVTVQFTLPPRAKAMVAAAKTPKKTAPIVPASAVLDDLMEEITSGYVPSPRLPTPEGLGRYSIMPQPGPSHYDNNIGDDDYDEDDDDDLNQTIHMSGGIGGSPLAGRSTSIPSHPFGSASGSIDAPPGSNIVYDDDSFDNDDSIDSDGSPQQGIQHQHQYSGTAIEDDSFDSPGPYRHDNFTNTGVGSGENVGNTSEAGLIFGRQDPGGQGLNKAGQFNILQLDEMMTFHGGRLEDAAGREVEESPLHGLAAKRSGATG